MLGHEDAQVSLFDITNIAPGFALPPDSIYERMRQLGSRLVKDEPFAQYYSSIGRASVPPALLSKVMLLMYLEGVSDRQAEDSARFDLRWMHALELPLDEAGSCHTSLSRFRLRLLTHDATHVLFERVLDLARELGILSEEPATRVVDSAPVLGAGAVQNTFTLIDKESEGSGLKSKLDPLFEGKDYESRADIDWSVWQPGNAECGSQEVQSYRASIPGGSTPPEGGVESPTSVHSPPSWNPG